MSKEIGHPIQECNKKTCGWPAETSDRPGWHLRDHRTFRHGTRYAYQVKKCHCQECQAWQTARMKRYWARRTAAGRPKPNGWAEYNEKRNYA